MSEGRYTRAIQRLGHTRWFAAVGRRVAPRIDRVLYPLSGGRLTATGRAVFPTLLLTTTGRRTGRRRTTPLLYARDGDRLVIAGSNWGQPRPPAWALNLLADPEAEVMVGRDRRRVRARAATDDERERLWPELERVWPAYRTYRERAGREIVVFVLEDD